MPTYDYECDSCGNKFEEFQSMTDKPLKKCPQCKKPKLRRLLGSGAAIIFKGSGFYQTDYRSESYKSGAKAEESKTSAADNGAPKGDAKGNAAGKTARPAPPTDASAKSSENKPKSSK